MKKIIEQINLQFIKRLLLWIATAITALPYSDRKSRFLDRLIALAEE